MRRYLSVLSLQVRSTIYKIIGIFVLLAVVEWVSFAGYLERAEKETEEFRVLLQTVGEGDGASGQESWEREVQSYALGRAVKESHMSALFYLSFAGMFVVLTWAACRTSSKYTVKRLSVRCREVYFLWAGYHLLCVGMLFAWQLVIVFFMDRVLCMRCAAWAELPQRLFVTFYQQDFLHSLLPLADPGRWIGDLAFVLAAGIVSVFVGYETLDQGVSRGKARVNLPVIALIWNLAFFARGLGSWKLDIVTVAVSLFCIVWCLAFMLKKKRRL